MRKPWCKAAGLMVTGVLQTAFAAHPLVTDDTGTQGRGNLQFELSQDHGQSKRSGVTSKERAASLTLTRGLTETLDVFIGSSLLANQDPSEYDGTRRGAGDVATGLKWRYREEEATSMALKATVTLPTGREAEGLGKGRSTQSLLHITQMEFGDLSLLVNIGLTRNDNTDVVGERKSLWNTSAGAVYALDDQLSLVFEMGSRKQEALSGGKHPSFAQIGAIWHPSKDLDLDFGLKLGLNSAETDRTIGVGLTKRWGE